MDPKNNTELKLLYSANFLIPLQVEKMPYAEPNEFRFTNDKFKFTIYEKKFLGKGSGQITISIYDANQDKNIPFPLANISTKDVFSPKTRKEIATFLKKRITTNIDDFINKLYSEYQIWINLEKQKEEEKKEIQIKSEQLHKKAEEARILKEKEIAKELFETAKPKDILDVIPKWDMLFGMFSHNNPQFGRISLHTIIGQEIINSRLERLGISIDPRISILYFKPSGTGGSAGWNITCKIAENLGLMCNTISSATDAALIGSVETEENPETGERSPIFIKGLLDKSRSNIISWSEPKNLFSTSKDQHEGNTKNYLMSALNLIGDKETHLERPMKNGIAFVDCEASMVLATVKPKTITDDIIDSGFMQRFHFINKVLEVNERALNAIWDINTLTTIDEEGNIDRKDQIKKNLLIEEITKKLQYLKRWGEIEENKIFYIRNDAAKYFKMQEQIYFNQIKNMKNSTERVKEKLETFQTFTVRKAEQIAMHHAALRFSNIIDIEDAKYACEEIIQPQMHTLVTYLEESWIDEVVGKKEKTDEDILHNAYIQYMIENSITKVSKKEFIELISKTFHKSQDTSYRKYKPLLEKGIIIEDKDKFITFSCDGEIKHFDKKETPYQGTSPHDQKITKFDNDGKVRNIIIPNKKPEYVYNSALEG